MTTEDAELQELKMEDYTNDARIDLENEKGFYYCDCGNRLCSDEEKRMNLCKECR